MANTTRWIAGSGVGFTWTLAFGATDLNTLANGASYLSSVADITNQTALDLYCDISIKTTLSSTTQTAGAYYAIYLAALLQDGTTYGDGMLTTGSPSRTSYAPPYAPVGTLPLTTVASQTNFSGFIQGILIPPGSFRFVFYNAGAALASTNAVYYRTYNVNLNG